MTSSSRSQKKEDPTALPPELHSTIADVHAAITKIDTSFLVPLTTSTTRPDLLEKQDPLDKARVDLTSAFAVTSLMWMWLKTQGEDPKESEVKSELDRVKSCRQRLKEIEIKNTKHPRVDQDAAKRFVKSGLWQPGKPKIGSQDQGGSPAPKRKRK